MIFSYFGVSVMYGLHADHLTFRLVSRNLPSFSSCHRCFVVCHMEKITESININVIRL